MKIIKYIALCVVLFSITLLSSCVNDVDFDQTEDILPTPVFESSLIFSNLEASAFLDDITLQEVIVITDTTRLEYINSDFFVDQLLKTNLTFRFTNSLNRNFNIDFEFVTDEDEQRYLAQIDVPAGTPDTPIFVESNFLIEEPELSAFEEATKLIYRITLPPSATPLDPTTVGSLNLESKATFYFEL